MEELIQIVLSNYSTLKSWKNDFSSKEWNQANNLHKTIFKSSLNQKKNCGCVEDFYSALLSKYKLKNIMEKSKARFVLKSNKIIQAFGMEIISEHSTEEQYLRLLKIHPSHIVSFETYPSDWQKLANVKSTKKTEEVKEAVVLTEADALADINGTPRPDAKNEIFEELNENEAQLSELTNSELKSIISSMGLEVPKGNKSVLVDFILANESK